jgi:hypothetical protein
MHFAIANPGEMQVNADLFNAVEEVLRTRTVPADEAKLKELREFLSRTVQKPRPPNPELPTVVTNANFTIRKLMVTIPTHRWPNMVLGLACPNPHCHKGTESTVEHLPEHKDHFSDGVLHDPLVTTLAGLMGWRLNMADERGFTCPFFGKECYCRAESLTASVITCSTSTARRRKRTMKSWELSGRGSSAIAKSTLGGQ